MVIAIIVSCALTFVIATGFLLFLGRFGQRGLVWTSRMEDDQ